MEIRQDSVEIKYEIGTDIGKGQFATVKRCTHRETRHEYAAKFIRKRRGGGRRGAKMEDITKEIELLSETNHRNIINLYEVYDTNREVILILELVDGGELFEYLSLKDKLCEEEASAFIKQILDGVEHLHSKHIAHLDLKPENILLQDKNSTAVKLIDFGLSRKILPTDDQRAMMGTAEFIAPEVVSYESLTIATDMWSIGVITYIILSGASPFLGDNQQETYHNITAINYEFDEEYFNGTSDLAKDFINKLLIKDQRKRATVKDCLNHPWIKPVEKKHRDLRRSSVISTEHLKKFIARQRWKRSMRVVSLCNRLSRSIQLRRIQSSDTLGSISTEEKKKLDSLIQDDSVDSALETQVDTVGQRKEENNAPPQDATVEDTITNYTDSHSGHATIADVDQEQDTKADMTTKDKQFQDDTTITEIGTPFIKESSEQSGNTTIESDSTGSNESTDNLTENKVVSGYETQHKEITIIVNEHKETNVVEENDKRIINFDIDEHLDSNTFLIGQTQPATSSDKRKDSISHKRKMSVRSMPKIEESDEECEGLCGFDEGQVDDNLFDRKENTTGIVCGKAVDYDQDDFKESQSHQSLVVTDNQEREQDDLGECRTEQKLVIDHKEREPDNDKPQKTVETEKVLFNNAILFDKSENTTNSVTDYFENESEANVSISQNMNNDESVSGIDDMVKTIVESIINQAKEEIMNDKNENVESVAENIENALATYSGDLLEKERYGTLNDIEVTKVNDESLSKTGIGNEPVKVDTNTEPMPTSDRQEIVQNFVYVDNTNEDVYDIVKGGLNKSITEDNRIDISSSESFLKENSSKVDKYAIVLGEIDTDFFDLPLDQNILPDANIRCHSDFEELGPDFFQLSVDGYELHSDETHSPKHDNKIYYKIDTVGIKKDKEMKRIQHEMHATVFDGDKLTESDDVCRNKINKPNETRTVAERLVSEIIKEVLAKDDPLKVYYGREDENKTEALSDLEDKVKDSEILSPSVKEKVMETRKARLEAKRKEIRVKVKKGVLWEMEEDRIAKSRVESFEMQVLSESDSSD